MTISYILKKIIGYKFLIIFIVVIWTYSLISYLVIKNKTYDWVVIVILLLIFTFHISKRVANESGWKLMANKYGANSSPIIIPKKLFPIYGSIGGFDYPINMLFSRDGLLLKVNLLMRYGHKNLRLPWPAISKIIVRGALSKERKLSFWQKVDLHGSDKKFTELKLKDFPDIFIELPWTEEFKENVPKDVKVEVRD